ncbi:Na+/H+ antiporter NhaC family protein [Paenibacillus elgii]
MSFRQLVIIVGITVLGIAAAYMVQIPVVFGFSAGLLALILISLHSGIRGKELGAGIWEGVRRTKEVVWLLLLVGMILPCWAVSGTVDELVRWALAVVQPQYALTFSFLICAFVSMILGTSTGTLSAVGVPLIGMAIHVGVPLPYVAGAVVSGIFVGDRTSPFSSAHQLIAASTETSIPRQWRAMAPTSALALLVSLAFYGWLDLRTAKGLVEQSANLIPSDLGESLVLLIPILVLLGSIVLRLKTKYGFLLSIAAAIIVGSLQKGVGPAAWLKAMWSGAEHSIVEGKGLLSMISLVSLIVLAGAFNGILERSNLIGAYIERMMGEMPSLASATWRTGAFGLVLCLISCTQTLPIIMSGRNILPLWNRRFSSAHLSRVIADTSAVLAAAVPWNLLAVLCSTFVGVPVEQYLPFAIFLWSLPLCTYLYSGYLDRAKVSVKA